MGRAGLRGALQKAALAAVVCFASEAGAVELKGAGATFPANLYEQWISEFNRANTDVTVTYSAVGSGEGIRQFSQGSVAFGATERPLSDKQVEAIAGGVLHVPTTAGMIVFAYNIPGLDKELRLSQESVAGILSGRIKAWNDPVIQAANPGANLPAKDIALVARRDSSGTTFSLTSHLAAVSSDWKEVGTTIVWPKTAQLVAGNEGVAGRIAIAEYSIGYVEYSFAARLNLRTALVENKSGQFVRADAASGAAALASTVDAMPADGRQSIPNPEGETAYPIVTYSWVLLRRENADAAITDGLKRFFGWGLADGQALSDKLGYIPLPAPVAERAKAILAELR
ncbi:phosphate ABC transporter substrate-binding protein PstS [Pseudochelatococcus contaminans]|uniref:Phosphate-binding protein PstS n=1 Tax=Pseudochelatococcus contaminans TaxID=1538103 RepID=A0A7W6EG21_9HYPH|nr:phosphate ABC transporter substrate-binding protein PstS [Pseudochelatococcus contaminans]MBB3809163.1 phosphate transport system substrate-binding protein [Pseudochelatococcus contaminans]